MEISIYVLAYIDKSGSIRISEPSPDANGYCYAHPKHKCAHKESIGIETWVKHIYWSLYSAKTAYLGQYKNSKGVPVILQLTDDGAGHTIWVSPSDRAKANILLKIWHSCYGGWTVKELNA